LVNNATLGSEEQLLLSLEKQSPSSHGELRVRERNIVSVNAKKDHPQFIYNRVYVNMDSGKCLEYNVDNDTSLLTRDKLFKEFMDRPYAVIPQGKEGSRRWRRRRRKEELLVNISQMDRI
jgi:hypothetical protein